MLIGGGGVSLIGRLPACSSSAITSSDELELSLAIAGAIVSTATKQASVLRMSALSISYGGSDPR